MNEQQIIRKYRERIDRFLTGELSAEEFANQYLNEFKSEKSGLSEETFRTLQYLFGEADAYCADPDLRDDEWDIDENELKAAARTTASELDAIL